MKDEEKVEMCMFICIAVVLIVGIICDTIFNMHVFGKH